MVLKYRVIRLLKLLLPPISTVYKDHEMSNFDLEYTKKNIWVADSKMPSSKMGKCNFPVSDRLLVQFGQILPVLDQLLVQYEQILRVSDKNWSKLDQKLV